MKLSREQQLVSDYVRAMEPLQRSVDRTNTPEFGEFVDGLVGALAAFGQSEQQSRRGERSKTLGVQPEKGRGAAVLGTDHNARGLKSLDDARKALGRLKVRENLPKSVNVRAQIDEFQSGLREALFDMDISAEEASELDEGYERIFKVARRGRPAEYFDALERELAELEKLRKRKDRGVAGNPFPVWKVIAAVVMLGAFVWLFFQCHVFGGCTATHAAIAFLIAAGASYFLLGC